MLPATCRRSDPQVPEMSPDHIDAPNLCMPAKLLRGRANMRRLSPQSWTKLSWIAFTSNKPNVSAWSELLPRAPVHRIQCICVSVPESLKQKSFASRCCVVVAYRSSLWETHHSCQAMTSPHRYYTSSYLHIHSSLGEPLGCTCRE